MRNLKKFLALVLAVMMVMGLMVTANAAVNINEASPDYQLAVDVLNTLKIVKGSGKGVYGAEDNISRAEFAMMLFRIATGYTKDSLAKEYAEYAKFSDVPANQWYAGAVGYAASEGLLRGYGNGTYGPNDPVTRNQVVIGLARVLGWDKNKELQGASTAKNTAELVKFTHIADVVKEDGSMEAAATRQEVAQMFFNTLVYENYVTYNSSNGNYDPKTYGSEGVTQTPGQLLFDMEVSNSVEGTDDFGRPVTASGVTIAGKALTIETSAAAVATYTAPETAANIATALKGYSLEATPSDIPVDTTARTVTSNKIVFTDGNDVTPGDIALSSSSSAAAIAALTGYGKTVEIYATNKVINKIVVVNDYLAKIKTVTAATDTAKASVTATVYYNNTSKDVTFETEAYAKDEYVVVHAVVKDTSWTIKEMTPAKALTNVKFSLIGTDSVTVDGTPLYYAGNFNGSGSGQIDLTGANRWTNSYNLYLNDAGYILGGEVYTETEQTEAPSNYLYVVSASFKKASSGEGGSEVDDSSVASDPVVRATVVFTDGTSTIVNLAIGGTAAKPTAKFPMYNGTTATISLAAEATAGEMANLTPEARISINNWFAYSVTDGKYTLTAINTTASVKETAWVYDASAGNITVTAKAPIEATAGDATSGNIHYSTSATVLTALKFADNKWSESHYTGLPTANGTINSRVLLLVDRKAGTITHLYYIGSAIEASGDDTDSTEAPEYAYAVKKGAEAPNGTVWTFAIKGVQVERIISGDNEATVGEIYTLTAVTTGDNAGSYTVSEPVEASSGDITVVDPGNAYIVVKIGGTDTTVSIASNYEVYDVSDDATVKGEPATLVKGQTIEFILNDNGAAVVIYITDQPD